MVSGRLYGFGVIILVSVSLCDFLGGNMKGVFIYLFLDVFLYINVSVL